MLHATLSFLPGFGATHLWFLYSLLLLYAVTLGVRAAVVRWLDRSGAIARIVDSGLAVLARWWVLPILLAVPVGSAFLSMAEWFRWFGIPTPDQSLVPPFAAAVAFTTAFGFGRRWAVHLAGGLPHNQRVLVRHVGQRHPQVAGVGRVEIRGALRDGAGAHQLLELAVEILHAVEGAVAHGVEQ